MMTKTTPKRVSTIILALILTALLSTAAFAAESRASALIFSHSCSASAGTDGEMDVTFSITGKKIMSIIGAKSIYFYVKNGNTWKFDKLYTQYYTGMSAENKLTHGNTITYQGKAGTEYKIVVTLFVEDSEGATDSRTYTKYVNT
jgi:hypothetical protein